MIDIRYPMLQRMQNPLYMRSSTFATLAFLIFAARAGAGVVFQSDFTTDPTPNFELTGGTGSTATFGTTGPGGSRALQLLDANTGSSAVGLMDFDSYPSFDTSAPDQGTLSITLDLAVTSMGSVNANNNSIPRVLLRSTTTGGTTISSESLTIGLGRSGTDRIVLFAARGDNAAPSASSAVILHDFGLYVAPASDIDTNDLYVSIAISYLQGSSEMKVTASQAGADAFSTEATVTGFGAATTYTNTTTAFLAATGTSSSSNLFIDNLLIQTIPEPAAALLGSLAALGLLRRRR